MLHRAANNAYSWWWASHIRTRQGKWLQQNLQDMEEKVTNILKIIEEDADSFAKRAEMYYKNRPELINFVEESYKAYRSLAERYEHMSGELQQANKTIASIFPDQVQLEMEDDYEDLPKAPNIDHSKVPKAPESPKFKIPITDMKNPLPSKQKKSQDETKRTTGPSITKDEAQAEIDKFQKEILVLQTEKEFVKSSYEGAVAKYWEIDREIEEMHDRICFLQDEFCMDKDIEDNEARALMTVSALKSCEDTLAQLQEQQKRSTEEAQVEYERVKDAGEKLKAFKERYLEQGNQKISDEAEGRKSFSEKMEEDVSSLKQGRQEIQSMCDKVKEFFEMNSNSPLTVMELADKIDELVTKVLRLESAISSQVGLVKRLKSETNELQENLQSLEEDKMSLLDDSKNLSDRVRELEKELQAIQGLNKSVEDHSSRLQTEFTETCRNLDCLSETLQTPKKLDEVEIKDLSQEEESSGLNAEEIQELEDKETPDEGTMNLKEVTIELDSKIQDIQDLHLSDKRGQENHIQPESCCDLDILSSQQDVQEKNSPHTKESALNVEAEEDNDEQTDSPHRQPLFSSGLEDREKILVTEYTSILRNYKETKNRLSNMEKKNRDSLVEIMTEIQELKTANAKKDVEIQSLRLKLNDDPHLPGPDENMNSNSKKSGDSQQSRARGKVDNWKLLFSEFQKKSSNKSNPRMLEDLLKERNIDFATRSKELFAVAATKSALTEEDIKKVLDGESSSSEIEGRFRRDIEKLLDENIKFWMRFSTSYHQIQKFQMKVNDMKGELSKLNGDKKKHQGITSSLYSSARPDAALIEKNLKDIQAELSMWLQQNVLLKGDLQSRFKTLCNIEEEILKVAKLHSEKEDSKFTTHQAAKFQGEVLNMQQENNKVADEVQAAFDQVKELQIEVEKTLSRLNENVNVSGSKSQRYHHSHSHSHGNRSNSRDRVPLRAFLFGAKSKKSSIFSCMSLSHQKQYNNMRAAAGSSPM